MFKIVYYARLFTELILATFIILPFIKKSAVASLLTAIFLLSVNYSIANTNAAIDLEAVMKQMRFEYTQAIKAPTASVFNQRMLEFKRQLAIAQQFEFSKPRQLKATEGLGKVEAAIDKLNLPVTAASLAVEKSKLEVIDDLRRQYHDKKPSLWERFFELFFGPNEEKEPLILLDNN